MPLNQHIYPLGTYVHVDGPPEDRITGPGAVVDLVVATADAEPPMYWVILERTGTLVEVPEGLLTRVPTVHRFDSSGQAYDASQCDAAIHHGDILHVPSEHAVAVLSQAWPVAVTVNSGSFDSIVEGTTWGQHIGSYTDETERRTLAEGLDRARRLAIEHGYPLAP